MLPRYQDIFLQFLKLGSTAFGGPAMIPYIRRMAVEQKGWLTDESFRMGMALCQSIPGATAMQVAAYVGLRVRGVGGALLAFLGFSLPAFILITALSAVYFTSGDVDAVVSMFEGLKFIVCALILHAAFNFSSRYLEQWKDKVLALGTGLVVGFKGDPVLAIVGAVLLGLFVYRGVPGGAPVAQKSNGSPLKRVGVLLGGGVIVFAMIMFMAPQLAELAAVMAKVDLFAFGGGYASLPLMLHEVTTARAWMSPEMFMDGIALGQVTPGPIVITSAFVGYHLAGFIGAAVGAVFAFTPSIIILVGVTPYYDRLQVSPLFQRAVRASLTSLVGLMAGVAARFIGAASWSPLGVIIAVLAFIALRKNCDVFKVVVAGAIVSTFLL